MDEITKKAKISRFLEDRSTKEAVLGVLNEVFQRKSKDRDVNNLASRFLALELLEEAKAELAKYRVDTEESTPVSRQVGL